MKLVLAFLLKAQVDLENLYGKLISQAQYLPLHQDDDVEVNIALYRALSNSVQPGE